MSIGVVLGGGGVTAQAFHAGVLAAVEDVMGWDVRTAAIMVGTSAGAPTAALLRGGLTGHDLVRRACGEAPDGRVADLVEKVGPSLDTARLRASRPPIGLRRSAEPRLFASAIGRPRVVRPG